jgi:transposase InsO family protein
MWCEGHFQEELYTVPTGKREGGQEIRGRSAPSNEQASSSSVNKDIVNTNYYKEIMNKRENEVSFCYFDRFKDCSFERKVGDNRLHVRVTLAGMDFIAVLDSGSNVTILGRNALKIIGRLDLEIEDVKLEIKVADGRSHAAYGYVNAPFTFDNRTHIIPTLVVPTLCTELLLGMDFWEKFGIVPKIEVDVMLAETSAAINGQRTDGDYGRIEDVLTEEAEVMENELMHLLTPEQQAQLDEVIKRFPAAEDGRLSKTNVLIHDIDTGEAKPVFTKGHVFSPYLQRQINAELDKMEAAGIIEKGTSDWCNPIVPVKKANGEVRLCLDARKLNAVTVKDRYPLPHAARILGRLEAAKYFSTVDMKQAFFQVGLSEEAKKKCSFQVVGRSLYNFVRMPFGCVNSAATQAKLMDKVLGFDLEPRVFVYLDDIVITSKTFEEHLELLAEVARRMKIANLTVNPTKSKFCQREIAFLGYILSEEGLRPSPKNVTAIVNYPVPKKKKDVRRLMGMANFYHRFIADYSEIMTPISNLVKGDKSSTAIIWTEEADRAFREIKDRLISTPVLSPPDFNLPFVVQTDASDMGVGGTLTQIQDETETVIAYFSKKLTSCQRRYAATERELLAVVLSIEHFRPYIEGAHFTVMTDCSALTWLKNMKVDGSNRLSRWALKLQSYDMTVVHKKGKYNIVPDALSRSFEVAAVTTKLNWYQTLKEKIADNPMKHAWYKLEEDVVFKYVSSADELGDYRFDWKMVVPPEEQADVLQQEHDESGHFGHLKTLERVRLKYFWPKMSSQVKKYCNRCDVCQASKTRTVANKPHMGQPKRAEFPWQFVSVDFLGPLIRSKTGKLHLLVVTDWFSKYVILQPMRAAEAKSLVKFMEEQVFLVFGVPEVLVSDNGSQFTSKHFASLLEKYQVHHFKGAAYHPQSNPAERINKVINASLRCYVGDDHRTWDEAIGKIAHAINGSKHASTKFTPNFINFGRELVVSGEDFKKQRELGTQIYDDDYLEGRRRELFGELFTRVKKNIDKAFINYSHYYNLRKRPLKYDVGDVVWMENHHQSSAADKFSAKLAPKYRKCRIVKKKGTNVYVLEDMDGKRLGAYDISMLKRNLD